MSIPEDVLESISKMTADRNILHLPKNEIFKNYTRVKQCLITAGGKYKKNTFVFPDDAKIVKDRLLGGEVVNDKKKFQFFGTPSCIVEKIVKKANIKDTDIVLEPSAGHGAIVKELEKYSHNITLVELWKENVRDLENQGYSVVKQDFLEFNPSENPIFDKIVANPPFTNNQDIDHVMHMYHLLKDDGTIVTINKGKKVG